VRLSGKGGAEAKAQEWLAHQQEVLAQQHLQVCTVGE
jgi:hypothetical protein